MKKGGIKKGGINDYSLYDNRTDGASIFDQLLMDKHYVKDEEKEKNNCLAKEKWLDMINNKYNRKSKNNRARGF